MATGKCHKCGNLVVMWWGGACARWELVAQVRTLCGSCVGGRRRSAPLQKWMRVCVPENGTAMRKSVLDPPENLDPS